MPRPIDLANVRLAKGAEVIAQAYTTVAPFLVAHPDMAQYIHIGDPAASFCATSEAQVHLNVLSLDAVSRPSSPDQIVDALASFLVGLEPPSLMTVTTGVPTEGYKVIPVLGLTDWSGTTFPPTFAVGFGPPLKL